MEREIKFKTILQYKDGTIQSFFIYPFNDLLDDEDSNKPIPSGAKHLAIGLQYTGLKDKNGKEIYEGDILQVAGNKKYEVKYCTGGESNFEWFGGMFILHLNEENFFGFDEYAMKTGGIIGNIYENPELLNP